MRQANTTNATVASLHSGSRHHGCDHGVEGGDNTINAAEAADGIVITGTAEAGSTVLVNGVPATVAATAPTPRPCRLRPRTARSVTVTSTDAAGNTAHDTRTSRWTAAPR
jgi:hypothetical protein